MKIMNNSLLRMAGFFGKDGDKMQDLARAEIFRSLFWATETHSQAMKQAKILADSQGDTYKPFISGEVNKAIANLISAMKPHQELIKLMVPGSSGPTGTNININNNNSSAVQYLSPDKAVALIRENSLSLVLNPTAMPELGDIPDISARTQDLSKIGIRKKLDGPTMNREKDPIGRNTQFDHGQRDKDFVDEDFRD
jgi:hypothetical protein